MKPSHQKVKKERSDNCTTLDSHISFCLLLVCTKQGTFFVRTVLQTHAHS